MKRFFLSHVGTIFVVCLVAVVGLANPENTKRAIDEAWSGLVGGRVARVEVGPSTPSLWTTLQQSDLFSKNSPAEWVVVLAALLIGILAGKIVSIVVRHIGRTLGERRMRAHVVTSLAGPASLALFTFGLGVGLAVLEMNETLHGYLTKTVALLYIVSVVWYVYNLVEVIDLGFERLRGRVQSRLDAQLIPLIRKSLRVVLVMLAALYVAKNVFGQPVGAWLAGLGIAGLALSLAAQDSLKSLFGSIVILLDRPFKVGERILYSGYDGTVEDIGFRSTKLRLFTGHLVTIPNANIASNPVENPSRRPFIRRTMNLTLVYDTTREKIVEAVAIVRRILDEPGLRESIHPTIQGEDFPPRVFFNEFNADSLNVQVMYWHAPPDWWAYMEHGERLNLRIFEEFERAGIEFAFPTRTVYLAGDPRRKLALEMLGGDLK